MNRLAILEPYKCWSRIYRGPNSATTVLKLSYHLLVLGHQLAQCWLKIFSFKSCLLSQPLISVLVTRRCPSKLLMTCCKSHGTWDFSGSLRWCLLQWNRPLTESDILKQRLIFSCDQAALQMVFSVCPSVRLSVRPSVCHTFLTMFPSSYHHEIFRNYYHGQEWCPCKRSRSEVKGQGHRGQHPT